jgi:hypothetical protein
LFVVLTLSVNASRIREQFFDFLGRLGQLAFYIPQLSINVVAKIPGILTWLAWFVAPRHIGSGSRAPWRQIA